MAQLTKDTVEAPASTRSSTENKPNPKSASSHSRTDAVSLEIPVRVHGSRASSASRGATPQTERFEEQTSTMIVFAKGGVLRMDAAVASGQMLVVTNSKSRQDAICRVLNVRSFPNMQSYVEIEFTQPLPGYWGVHFPGEIPSTAQASAPKTSIASEQETKLDRPPEVPQPPPVRPAAEPSAASKNPVQSTSLSPYARASSPFAAIGTREEVQPAAAATSVDRVPRALAEPLDPARNDPRKRSVLEAPAEGANSENRPVVDAVEGIRAGFASLLRPSAAPPEVEKSDSASRTFGSFATTGTLPSNRAVSSESFGMRLGVESGQATSATAGNHHNWALIAACLGLLFAAVAGGVWYFRSNFPTAALPGKQAVVTKPTESTLQQATPPNPSPPTALSEPTASALTPRSSPALSSKESTVSQGGAVPSARGKAERELRPESPAISEAPAGESKDDETVKPRASTATPQPSADRSPAALAPPANAHPLWSQRTVDTTQLPSVEPAAGVQNGPGALPGMASSGIALPPAPVDEPVRVGGKIKEPQVISAPLPVYPAIAQRAHVEGDVVIDTQIDKSGAVIHMKVVSGPTALRQAALDALRKWKYQPSQLDGQPVAVQMLVTVRFRL
jgi:TonB family protein